ncbi:MAG TPA: hypothetical protein VGT98_00255 [Candidatus Elarobacter sp.]|nr:hypothetical protein [Candidatus Elarobacter sp.]HEV2740843.1 hypothetical protein [Candidatus Elarobacter sp.]
MACAPGTSTVTPSTGTTRVTQSGGTGGGGGGATGGGGVASTCQPLPGTCVLNATIALASRVGGLKGQIRFERSPTRMAVTGTLQPGNTLPNSYYAILVDTGTGVPGAPLAYAARGVMDPQTKTVTLETIPGDGLFSQTPNAMPVDPNFIPDRVFGVPGWSFISDPTPPSADTLALFAAVQAGSSVRIATLGVPGQICPCPPPGPVVPALLQYDLPPSSLR